MKIIKTFVYCFLLIFLIEITACSKSSGITTTKDSFELKISSTPRLVLEKSQKWRPALKKICVVFGYGYNDKKIVSEIKNKLADEFGLDKDGGRIIPCVFPADFKYAGSSRISLLAGMLENKNMEGILILGAPEYTHNALLKISSYYGGKIPYPVFSLFPQDDVLGIEATSDFVLEHPQTNTTLDEESAEEEQPVTIDKHVYTMIESCIKYMQYVSEPLPEDEHLHSLVQKIIGIGNSITRYRDPDTGLQSINHFVLNK